MKNHVLFRTFHAINKVHKMNLHDDAKKIFTAAVESVRPENLLRNCVHLIGNRLTIQEKEYVIEKPCHVVGFGKAVLSMGMELEKILGDKLKSGICTIPSGMPTHSILRSKIEYIEGAKDNLPDGDAVEGAERIKQLCDELQGDDFLIVLISGGGSALLPLPREGLRLEEKLFAIKELVKRGADILELNCVRKKLSRVKGGGLARSAYPARVVSLILSDVIGDPLDFIASGPTVRNSDHPADALEVIKRHGLLESLPESVIKIVSNSHDPPGDYSQVDNFIIGNNHTACSAAKTCAENLGFSTIITSTTIKGDVRAVAKQYAQLTSSILQKQLRNLDCTKPICIIGGGEPTVVLKGSGKGGRNQELALAFAGEIAGMMDSGVEIGFLSCGTDGIDGPTDAAGAYAFSGLVQASLEENLEFRKYLDDNDSYNFYRKFQSGRFLHKIGHTGTNVMDVHILLVK